MFNLADADYPVEGPYAGNIECQICERRIARYWVRRGDWPAIRGCEPCMAGKLPEGLVEYEIYERVTGVDGKPGFRVWDHGKVTAQQMEVIRRESVRKHPERTINMVFPPRFTSMGTCSLADWMRIGK